MQSNKSDTKKSIELRDKVKKDVCSYFDSVKKILRDEEELYFGQAWKNSSDYRPYENNVFDIIETAVPILTDNLPAPTVEVLDKEKEEGAKVLKSALAWVNEDQMLPLKLPDVVRGALVTGTGYIHTYYDYESNNGEGRNIYEILHYTQVKLSSRTDNIENCDKARIELYRSRDWLKLTYPNHKEALEKTAAPQPKGDDDDRGLEKVDSGTGYAKRTTPKKYQDDDTLELVLTYIKDFTLEEIPEKEIVSEIEEEAEYILGGELPDITRWQNHPAHIESHNEGVAMIKERLGVPQESSFDEAYEIVQQLVEQNPEAAEDFEDMVTRLKVMLDHIEDHKTYEKLNPEGKRLKYKGGYRVIETVNDIVLYDGPNKNEHGEIPLAPFYCYRNGTIYGHGMIRNIADSQRMKTVMGYKEYKGLQLISNPQKEYNKDAGITSDDITNEDGAAYGVPAGQGWAVRNIQPGQVSEQGVRFQRDRVDTMAQISGMSDPTRGEMPDHRMSEVTVTKIQNQALGRIRLKDRQNQLYSLVRLAKLTASDIIQHWTTEKVLEFADDGSSIIYNPLVVKDMNYNIKPTSGSMSGVDRDAFNLFATSLLNTNRITFSQYAELVDMPKVDKLKKFAQENNEIEAQTQELTQQLQEVQMQNLKLRAQAAPETLSPDEIKTLEQIQREELLAQQTGVNEDQPEAME